MSVSFMMKRDERGCSSLEGLKSEVDAVIYQAAVAVVTRQRWAEVFRLQLPILKVENYVKSKVNNETEYKKDGCNFSLFEGKRNCIDIR